MKANKDYLKTMCESFILDSVVLDIIKSANQNEDLKIIELLRSNIKVALNLLTIGGFSEKEVKTECDIIMDRFTDDELLDKSYEHYEKIVDNFKNNIYR